jgi:hypothetical protein
VMNEIVNIFIWLFPKNLVYSGSKVYYAV